jgi:hypothetical protein
MEILDRGEGEVRLWDVDEARAWMREKKTRRLVDKVMDEHEAV